MPPLFTHNEPTTTTIHPLSVSAKGITYTLLSYDSIVHSLLGGFCVNGKKVQWGTSAAVETARQELLQHTGIEKKEKEEKKKNKLIEFFIASCLPRS